MSEKFIQIAVTIAADQRGSAGGPHLYALDEDGKVWKYSDYPGSSGWYRLRDDRDTEGEPT